MRMIYLCGTQWCSPCQFVRNHILKNIEAACPGQTEYIDIQRHPEAIDRFRVYRIPMLCMVDSERLVKQFSGDYPSKESLIEWLGGEKDYIDTELHRPC